MKENERFVYFSGEVEHYYFYGRLSRCINHIYDNLKRLFQERYKKLRIG